MSTIMYFEAPLVAKVDIVFKCIKSFSKDASCHKNVLRAQHLVYALCGEGYVVAKDLLCIITSMGNMLLGGKFPMSLT